MSSFKPLNLQGTAVAGGYSLVFNPPVNVVDLANRIGEAWVRPFPSSTTAVKSDGTLSGYTASTGANTNVTDPRTTPLTKDWMRLQAGDDVTFGDALSDPIAQVDVWVQADVDLDVIAH